MAPISTHVFGHITVTLEAEGFIRMTVGKKQESQFSYIQQTVKHVQELSEKGPYPLLADIRNLRGKTNKNRLWAIGELTEAFSAAAIVVDSHFSRLLASFFLSFNRTQIPTKLFSTEEDATQWILEFIAQQKDQA